MGREWRWWKQKRMFIIRFKVISRFTKILDSYSVNSLKINTKVFLLSYRGKYKKSIVKNLNLERGNVGIE